MYFGHTPEISQEENERFWENYPTGVINNPTIGMNRATASCLQTYCSNAQLDQTKSNPSFKIMCICLGKIFGNQWRSFVLLKHFYLRIIADIDLNHTDM